MRSMVKVALGRAGVIAAVLLALVAFAPEAEALVGNGGAISYLGTGDVTITFLAPDAAFRSYLVLYKASNLAAVLTPAGTPCGGCPTGGIFNTDTSPAGTTFVLTEAFLQANFGAGDEMVFAILVDENIDGVIDRIYYMGAAGRNADGIIHNDTQSGGPNLAIVGFEDSFGGGDFDSNDHIFSFFPVNLCDQQICPPPPPRLSDSEEPGSVIVFPKFIKGSVRIDGVAVPKTEIEVSVLCPKGVLCTSGQQVRLHGGWVCPGNARSICKELDFTLVTTVNSTITLNPSRVAVAGGTTVPAAPCNRGYLIMWVVDFSDRPIKFDGLIGDAVIRNAPGSAGAYRGIPIQADPALVTNALITLVGGGLAFDGDPGHYLGVAGKALSSVRFDRLTAPLVSTFLTMLTLDVLSNRPNTPTFVDFLFWNQNEVVNSTSTDFICWAEQQLSVDIDSNLTQESQGTPKGSFFGVASDQLFAPRTLLVIVETQEKNAAGVIEREYSYSTYHDSILVPTTFHP